jgi:hypothetical protein
MGTKAKWTIPTLLVYLLDMPDLFGKASAADFSKRSLSSPKNRLKWTNNDFFVIQNVISWRGGASSSSSPFRQTPTPRRVVSSIKNPTSSSAYHSEPQPPQQQQVIRSDNTPQKEVTKQVLDSFLTRDSRQTFIGMFNYTVMVKEKWRHCIAFTIRSRIHLTTFF